MRSMLEYFTKTKRCPKCGQYKELSLFYKNKGRKDGYSALCGECQRKFHRAYYYKNIEKVRKRYREIDKKFRLENPEKIKAWSKEYRQKNRDRVNAQSRKHGRTTKGRFQSYKHSAKVRNLSFKIDFGIFKNIINENKCFYCGNTGRVGIDRKNNTKGYIKTNIIPCCEICNRMKLTMTQEKFINQCRKITKNQGKI